MIKDIFKTSIYYNNVFNETYKNYFINILEKHIKEKKESFKSNVGGFQTPTCIFNDSEIEKKIVNDLIISNCSNFLKQFKIKKTFQLNNLCYWVNKNFKNSFNKPHSHGYNCLSGIYYLDVTKNSGDLVFMNIDKLNTRNHEFFDDENFFSEWVITPRQYDLILFFSETIHYVKPNNSDQDRISMSFNINITDV